MTDTKHSQMPWRVSTHRSSSLAIMNANDAEIATIMLNKYTDNSGKKERAAFIVTACNSHYELVEALRSIVKPYSEWDDDRIYDDLGSAFGGAVISARNALAKVKP